MLCYSLKTVCIRIIANNLICFILLFSGNFSQLCELISKNTEQLAKNAGHLDNALGTFDMQQHSLGVLGIL